MKWALALLMLCVITSVYADTTQRTRIFYYDYPGNPSPLPPGASYLPGQQGKIQATSLPLSDFMTINACAAQGSLVYGWFDDAGWVTITDANGGTASARLNGGGGHGREGQVSATSGRGTFSAGSFDPQTAEISYYLDNSGGGPSLLAAEISITYRSQNGYVWNDATQTCALDIGLVGIRVSNPQPAEYTDIDLWCEATSSGATITPSATGLTFTGGDWQDNNGKQEQHFTFNTGSIGTKAIYCNLNGKSINTSINIRSQAAPSIPQNLMGTSNTCVQGAPVVTLSWDAVQGALNYTVWANNKSVAVLPQHTSYTSDPAATKTWALPNGTGIWSVSAYDGLFGANATVSVMYSDCKQPITEIPDSFRRAYFSRKGTKAVRAYWQGETAVVIFTNYTTDMDTLKPQGSRVFTVGSQQALQFSTIDDKLWRAYTTSLR
jgi:hypothetical protein